MSDDKPESPAGEPRVVPEASSEPTEVELEASLRELDWQAWPAQVPPADFAQRVVQRAHPNVLQAARRRRRRWAAGSVVLAAAAALVLWLARPASEAQGQRAVSERTEVAIGRRGVAVLEAGAELRWRGDRVTQARGDVFYRVNPGGAFSVSTPSGSLEVLGTCFGVAVQPAAAQVRVYEGRVRASAAGQVRELSAGQSAELDSAGVHGADERSPATSSPALAPDDAAQARAATVQRLREKLAELEHEKSLLEARLRAAQALIGQSGGSAPERHRYDLSQDDWRKLAQTGSVMFRLPCASASYRPKAEDLDALGLMPEDAETIARAYANSSERVWKVVRPLCVAAVGSESVADLLGRGGCITAIQQAASRRDRKASDEAMREASEIRAGLRAAPAPGQQLHPVLEMFLTLTGEPALFEAELTRSFGPDDAKRITFNDLLCREQLTLAGPGRREE